MSGRVESERRGGALWLTLARPEKLNALDAAMVAALDSALDEAAADDEARVVVLRGAGRAFSAGYDLGEAPPGPRSEGEWCAELARDLSLTLKLATLEKPTVACVHGWCLGGALDLVLACDLVVASDDARFGIPEIRYGSGPVTLLLPFAIGEKHANELILTGDDVSAAEAHRLGLVNRVVPRERLEEETERLVGRIAPTPLEALRLTKRSLLAAREAMGTMRAQAAHLPLSAALNALDTPEGREFDRIAAEQGLKAALAWRACAYAEPGKQADEG
ncbi:MAG: enoyl-CoA hydratase/isomerase family protein [Thermoleophilia bacterium]|nr:enoyl-CoA hydratase/isomerase family protein [Thermoleophilia bacterium]